MTSRPSLLLVTVLLLLASGLDRLNAQPAGAATGAAAENKFRDLQGEWRRAGAGFACAVGPTNRLAPGEIKPEILSQACLHMGRFMVGDDAQMLSTTLGKPHKTLAQPKGATAWVYFLEAAGQYPYLVATVSKNRIVALQVTGPAAAKGYTYNHIDLGAPTDILVQYFGQPNHLEPSEEKDTELWAYRPWPFSFEVRGGHVTSIRINEPM
jgi:hypothetical protein